MTEYKVRWTAAARQDLDEIIGNIYKTLPVYAVKELDKIEHEAKDLYFFSEKYQIVPELERFGYRKYRQLLVDYWRVIYKVEGRTVYILLVVDTRRDLSQILLSETLLRDSFV
jgi:plasmid stabilization system protein ParE